jgi:hypothetical protein
MTVLQLVKRDKNLIQAFKAYKKRYLSVGKKPDMKKFLPNDLYHTMRLEGEKITRKEAEALFQ